MRNGISLRSVSCACGAITKTVVAVMIDNCGECFALNGRCARVSSRQKPPRGGSGMGEREFGQFVLVGDDHLRSPSL